MNNKKTGFVFIVAAIVAAMFSVFALSACGENDDDKVVVILKEFKGITFEDVVVDYDGEEHVVTVTGNIPSDAIVTYTNNKATEAGVYKAKAVIAGTDYRTLELTATLIINEVTPAKVKTEAELKAAVAEGGLVILENDITLDGSAVDSAGACVSVTKKTVINGNGHYLSVTGFNDSKKSNCKIIDVSASDCTVRLINLSIDMLKESNSYVGYMRGINIGNTENLTLELDNVSVNMYDYYALNIIRANKNLTINADKTKLSAWGAINNHASGVTFNATNSAFTGTNPHNSPNTTSNYFTTVIAAGYVLDGVDEFIEENLSANNKFTFTDCTIMSRIATVDDTPLDTVQNLIDVRSPFNNIVTLDNCTLTPDTPDNNKIRSVYDSKYIPEENKDDPDFVVNTNKIFINGTDVTDDENYVVKYFDE